MESHTAPHPRDVINEDSVQILDQNIGFCRYGFGRTNFLFICGAVGCLFFISIIHNCYPIINHL